MPSIVDNSEKREGSGRLTNKKGTPVFEETYYYLVKADYSAQPRADILLSSGLPIPGRTFGPGGLTICQSVSATRRADSTLYWDCSADFSSEVDEGSDGGGDSDQDPTAWVPVYETKMERLQEIVTKDRDDKPIKNGAGQYFESGLTISRFIPVWEFFQFEPATVSDFTVIGRNEVVNKNTFKGCAKDTLLCSVISSTLGFYYGQRRRLTGYQLKYNKKTWKHKRLDAGTSYLDANGDLKPYKIKDVEDNLTLVYGTLANYATDPSKKGQPSGGFDGDFPVQDPDKVGVVEFDIYDEVDFSSFLRI